MKAIKQSITFLAIILSGMLYSQSSITGIVTGHNPPFGSQNTHYLGWSDNDIDLRFRTANIERMELAKTEQIWFSTFQIDHGGFLGLSDEPIFFTKGDRSLLHLNGGNNGGAPQESGFRPWMRYGMTVTSNKDEMYVGIKNNLGFDQTEAVIAWSDNTGGTLMDNLVFKFTSGFGGTAAQNSTDGKEVARFAPDGNVGIGDFSDNGFGLDEQPTHRLDVAGEVRIRNVQLDPDPEMILTGVEEDAEGDYVLHYTPIEPLLDCDWETSGSGIYTGAPTSSCNTQNVAIGGFASANAKLQIQNFYPTSFTPRGIATYVLIGADESPSISYGMFTWINGVNNLSQIRYGNRVVSGGGRFVFGSHSTAFNQTNGGSDQSVGVYGAATNAQLHNIGVYGLALRDDCIETWGSVNIGVYGEARSSVECNPQIDWAGYFVGNMNYTGDQITVSDEALKEDIEELEGAIDIINQLQPKKYHFKTDEFSMMNLSDRLQYGLVAQELEEVLPNLVVDTRFPAKFDTTGAVISEAFDYKGVNYNGLIPILVQAQKEQLQRSNERQTSMEDLQEQLNTKEEAISELQDQMNEMYEMLALCCENQSKGIDPSIETSYELFQNNPNPFDNYTNISWKMAEDNVAKILVQDLSGREIATLVNEQSSKGLHSVRWETSDLPAGTYFYSLIVNDELMVKRAVKIK